MNKQHAAFVLIPSDARFLPIYENLIKPELEQAGYSVSHAGCELQRQSIHGDIVRSIAEADLIVADLTTVNRNVLHELGLSREHRAPTILISHSIDGVPFDLRPYRVILYDTDLDLAPKLRRALAETRTQHVEGASSFGRPAADFPSPRDETTETILAETPGSRRGVPAPPPANKSPIAFLVDGEQALGVIRETLAEIAADIGAVGDKMEQHRSITQAMIENPGLVDVASLSRLSSLITTDMHASALTLERQLPTLEKNVSILEENWTGYVNQLMPESEQETNIPRTLRESLSVMHATSNACIPSTTSYRDGIIRLSGISTEAGTASRRLSHQLDGVLAIIEEVCSFSARTIDLIDAKLAEVEPPT